jgi:hypothetical protein
MSEFTPFTGNSNRISYYHYIDFQYRIEKKINEQAIIYWDCFIIRDGNQAYRLC